MPDTLCTYCLDTIPAGAEYVYEGLLFCDDDCACLWKEDAHDYDYLWREEA